jgi:hypothetical protein
MLGRRVIDNHGTVGEIVDTLSSSSPHVLVQFENVDGEEKVLLDDLFLTD